MPNPTVEQPTGIFCSALKANLSGVTGKEDHNRVESTLLIDRHTRTGTLN